MIRTKSMTDDQPPAAKIMIDAETVKHYLEENEYAIIVKDNGDFSGVLAPDGLEDFDELPSAIAKILTALYGDVFNITFNRKIQ
jgi:hypothetical protein